MIVEKIEVKVLDIIFQIEVCFFYKCSLIYMYVTLSHKNLIILNTFP